jgi:hypothetical protein
MHNALSQDSRHLTTIGAGAAKIAGGIDHGFDVIRVNQDGCIRYAAEGQVKLTL